MISLFFKPRLAEIVFITIFVLSLASGSKMLSIDSDLGRHLTMGNVILDRRIIPTEDLFSHTLAGSSRPPYEWLSQVLFALSYRALGLDGVILFVSLILALVYTTLFMLTLSRCGSPLLSFGFVLLAAGVSTIHWLPRPHIFTMLFLVIWVELLDRIAREKNTTISLFPFLMLMWANLHGGFVFGFLVWLAYLTGWILDYRRGKSSINKGKAFASIGILSLFASVITPDHWRNWEAVFNNRSAFILNRTVETMRPNLIDPVFIPFTILLVVTILMVVINFKSLRIDQIFLVSGFAFLGILMARNTPLFALVVTPLLAEQTKYLIGDTSTWKKIGKRFSGFNVRTSISFWAPMCLIAMTVVFANFNAKYGQSFFQWDTEKFPVAATDFIVDNPQGGNMFNEFNWGGYILFRLFPESKVFIDSQTDFYGEGLVRDYDSISGMDDRGMGFLEKYNVEWMIVRTDSRLNNHLQWEILYEDSTAVILRKP